MDVNDVLHILTQLDILYCWRRAKITVQITVDLL